MKKNSTVKTTPATPSSNTRLNDCWFEDSERFRIEWNDYDNKHQWPYRDCNLTCEIIGPRWVCDMNARVDIIQ